ncbi:hypothetical protein VPMS16_2934 [Vibrio sp. 16]|nr:hypothetical protein VPMS16_2934 [Vibrio sp. 16]
MVLKIGTKPASSQADETKSKASIIPTQKCRMICSLMYVILY